MESPSGPVRAVQVGDDRCMVRGGQSVLLLAVVPVDLDRAEPGQHRRRAEDEVDPESLAAMEGAAPVIPPRERLGVGVSFPEKIPPAPACQGLDAAALSARLLERGVDISAMGKYRMRAVTYLDVGRDEVLTAAAVVSEVMQELAAPAARDAG